MTEFDKEITSIIVRKFIWIFAGTIHANNGEWEKCESEAIEAVKQAVDKYILRDYQLPSDSPVWDSLRTANEEHELQRKLLGVDKS